MFAAIILFEDRPTVNCGYVKLFSKPEDVMQVRTTIIINIINITCSSINTISSIEPVVSRAT